MKEHSGRWKLLAAAMIWGCAFSAQSAGTEYIGPWTFNCIRGLIGALTLYVSLPLLDRMRGTSAPAAGEKRYLLKAGAACGFVLTAASMLQQAGIAGSTAGKAGFLTSLYILFVPFLSVFLGRKITKRLWLAVLTALAGLYFLSISGKASFSLYDLLLIGCGMLFAVHIILIDRFTRADSVRLSCLQFLLMGVLCMAPMCIVERPALKNIMGALPALLYTGICSCGIAYTLQIAGQKNTDPSEAGILLSLESVFAAVSGFILLHQTMTPREISGCVLMFAAVILTVTSQTTEQ